MVPQRVVVHDELPKSANGKIDKRAIADLPLEPARPAREPATSGAR